MDIYSVSSENSRFKSTSTDGRSEKTPFPRRRDGPSRDLIENGPPRPVTTRRRIVLDARRRTKTRVLVGDDVRSSPRRLVVRPRSTRRIIWRGSVVIDQLTSHVCLLELQTLTKFVTTEIRHVRERSHARASCRPMSTGELEERLPRSVSSRRVHAPGLIYLTSRSSLTVTHVITAAHGSDGGGIESEPTSGENALERNSWR